MPWTNFHSHTHYCDGEGLVKDYIEQAIVQGMPAYGISSHAPICFNTDWCIPDERYGEYLKEVKNVQKNFVDQIEIYLGLEIDFIPGVAGKGRHLIKETELDYFIGSIHFVGNFDDGQPWNIDHTKELFIDGLYRIFGGNFLDASEQFYEISCQMLVEDNPAIIGHLDKIKMYNGKNEFFYENDKKYQLQVKSLLKQIKASNTIVEVYAPCKIHLSKFK